VDMTVIYHRIKMRSSSFAPNKHYRSMYSDQKMQMKLNESSKLLCKTKEGM